MAADEERDYIEMCVDRVLEQDLEARERRIEDSAPDDASRMAVDIGKTWDPGKTLLVSFTDGVPEVQEKVAVKAVEWSEHANIFFEFGDHADADIRISFQQPGSWSYLGTDAKSRPTDEPTMNYGWLTPQSADSVYDRVVLHEFGHALGAIHEHQSPAQGIPWDVEKVIEFYSGPPNNWSRRRIETNVLGVYRGRVSNSAFDRDSIMLYPVDNKLTIGDFSVGFNRGLSETDKSFIGTLYPKERKPEGAHLEVGGPAVSASIGAHGEQDRFPFKVTAPGKYVIETHGDTDVKMALFVDGFDERLAADDDSGRMYNARIETVLAPAQYVLRVWHYWPAGTGEYSVTLRAAGADG